MPLREGRWRVWVCAPALHAQAGWGARSKAVGDEHALQAPRRALCRTSAQGMPAKGSRAGWSQSPAGHGTAAGSPVADWHGIRPSPPAGPKGAALRHRRPARVTQSARSSPQGVAQNLRSQPRTRGCHTEGPPCAVPANPAAIGRSASIPRHPAQGFTAAALRRGPSASACQVLIGWLARADGMMRPALALRTQSCERSLQGMLIAYGLRARIAR